MRRREALRILLGAPLAATACRFLPKRSFEGRLVGASVDVGHRLRARIDEASGPAREVGVAIVGAGVAGLSAAWRLERLGHTDFAVFDLEASAGGTSAFGTDGVVPYPWGAHYVPVPSADNRGLVALLRETGSLDDAVRPQGREAFVVREPEERLFLDGRWHEGLFPFARATDEDRRELRRFTEETGRLAGERDARGRRAFTLPVAHCSDDERFTSLDRTTASEWLTTRGYRSSLLRWYVDYGCRDDYGTTIDQTSAWAMLFYHAARLARPGAATAPLLTWPEGNGRLVRHLASVAGPRLSLGRLVTDVRPEAGWVDLAVLDRNAGGLGRVRARQVILAVPRFVAARVIAPWREVAPPGTSEFTYGSWMVANLHLSRRPRSTGFPFAWDNVLHDSPSLGYVVATHQALRDLGPTVWTYYQPITDADPRAARQKLLELEHRDFCDAIVADLGRAHLDLESAIDRIDVWRWGHAMVRPTPGFVWGKARTEAPRSLGRVHMAHTDLSGVSLFEEAQYHGVVAAEAALRAERAGEVPSLFG